MWPRLHTHYRILSFSASAKIMDEERPFIPDGLECWARKEKSFHPRILWLFCRLGIAMFWLECQFWRLKWPAAWFDRSCHLSFLGVSPKWIFLLRLCSRFTRWLCAATKIITDGASVRTQKRRLRRDCCYEDRIGFQCAILWCSVNQERQTFSLGVNTTSRSK